MTDGAVEPAAASRITLVHLLLGPAPSAPLRRLIDERARGLRTLGIDAVVGPAEGSLPGGAVVVAAGGAAEGLASRHSQIEAAELVLGSGKASGLPALVEDAAALGSLGDTVRVEAVEPSLDELRYRPAARPDAAARLRVALERGAFDPGWRPGERPGLEVLEPLEDGCAPAELAAWLGSADVFVQVGLGDAGVRPLLEAAGCGCACVLVGAEPPALFREGTEVMSIGGDEPHAIEQAIDRLMEDQQLRRAMGRAAAAATSGLSLTRAAISMVAALGRLRGHGAQTRLIAPPARRRARPPRVPVTPVVSPDAALSVRPDVAPTILVPIHNAADDVERCLSSVVRNTTGAVRLLLIDDASTQPEVKEILRRYGQLSNVQVLVNRANLGFTATVNRGLRHAGGDVVLLNSDTEVPPGWLARLQAALSSAPDVATVTALSDNAGAFSAPQIGVANAVPEHLSRDEVGLLVADYAERIRPPTPTGSGFCLYIRRAALDDVGLFDEVRFPRGYGEESDWCMRAGARGWRHVIDDSTYVFHARERSFGAEKTALVAAGRVQVDEAHPGYTPQVRAFVAGEKPARARGAVAASFEAARSLTQVPPRVLYVLPQGGGGTPAANQDLMEALEGKLECLALTSDSLALRLWRQTGGKLELLDEQALARPWRVTDLTLEEYRTFARRVLDRHPIDLIHVRHLFKHTHDLPRLAAERGIPIVVSFHDFYLSCPTVHLLDDQDAFCGGRCTLGDGACRIPSPLLEGTPHLKHNWVHQWREEAAYVLERAAALVTTSVHTREVYLRSYPALAGRPFHIIEHGRALESSELAVPPMPGGPVRILVAGNLDVHKGAAWLEELLAHDATGRIELHFLGDVPERWQGLGVVHGRYARDEFASRAREIATRLRRCLLHLCRDVLPHAQRGVGGWAAGVRARPGCPAGADARPWRGLGTASQRPQARAGGDPRCGGRSASIRRWSRAGRNPRAPHAHRDGRGLRVALPLLYRRAAGVRRNSGLVGPRGASRQARNAALRGARPRHRRRLRRLDARPPPAAAHPSGRQRACAGLRPVRTWPGRGDRPRGPGARPADRFRGGRRGALPRAGSPRTNAHRCGHRRRPVCPRPGGRRLRAPARVVRGAAARRPGRDRLHVRARAVPPSTL